MDTVGNRHARKEIAMIKVVAPNMALVCLDNTCLLCRHPWLTLFFFWFYMEQKVIDRAIQAFGAAGLSDDFGLSAAFAGARSLRIADGPDEVCFSSFFLSCRSQQRV